MVILCFFVRAGGIYGVQHALRGRLFSPGAGYMLYARRDFLHLTDKELLLYADEPKKRWPRNHVRATLYDWSLRTTLRSSAS